MGNELSKSKSPYLLQHQNNPVHWKSWSSQTIERAKAERKLIFLSIGYATCHWCHVMEHESFEDQGVADLLNKHFISIKVDREEHPDVDQIYMDALHAMGQRGGWPLNMFLTPDLKPFYGGTYFPKQGFLQILKQVAGLWIADADRVQTSADQVRDFLNQQIEAFRKPKTNSALPADILESYRWKMAQGFDSQWGGFGPAPKFPPNTQIPLLLRIAKGGDKEALEMATKTLKEMARGGIYDHLGGGLARYSVDERWEIPHFEKMLYVNALSLDNYVEAWSLTGDAQFRLVAEDIAQYVLRDMVSSGGGFYSAEDADSEGHEGLFYVWTAKELVSLLNGNEFQFLKDHFGVTEGGNFEGGTNNLRLSSGNFWESRLRPEFGDIRKKLLAVREGRERPLLDDKQLTSWNGLMIAALSKAGRVLGVSQYVTAAQKAAQFILDNLFQNKKLLRRYRAGSSEYDGTLEDYSFLIHGLIELYQASFEEKWLLWAKSLQETQDKMFSDTAAGGYFFTSLEEKNLIVRSKEYSDNALPSANALSILNLARLSHYFLRPDWKESATRSLGVASELAGQYPLAYSQLLLADDYLKKEVYEFVILGDIPKLNPGFMPYVLLAAAKSKNESVIPLLQGKKALGGTTYFVCRDGACQQPTLDLSQALKSLSN